MNHNFDGMINLSPAQAELIDKLGSLLAKRRDVDFDIETIVDELECDGIDVDALDFGVSY